MHRGYEIIWLESTDSTNDQARSQLKSTDFLTVIAAENQTSGKGQRGNSWHSEPGKNLTFSIIVRPAETNPWITVKASEQAAISHMAALSVIDLMNLYGIPAKIKWPNDIYVSDRKICGILIENAIMGMHVSSSIIGIGLNVNQTNFPPYLPNPTSMQRETGIHTDTHLLLEKYMEIFLEYCRTYMTEQEKLTSLKYSYNEHLWRLDEPHEFYDYTSLPCGHLNAQDTLSRSEAEQFTGIIRGVSDEGRLIVENVEGELREFAFKEIGYKI